MRDSNTIQFIGIHVSRLRLLFTSIFILLSIFLLSLPLSTIHIDNSAHAASADTKASQVAVDGADNPNVITGGIIAASATLQRSFDTVGNAFNDSLRSVAIGAVRSAKFIVASGVVMGHVAQTGVIFVAHGVGNGIAFAVRIPAHLFGIASNTNIVSAIIKPADHEPVPVIDPNSSALLAARTKMTADEQTGQTSVYTDTKAAWPIHGIITTEFGVPELPYQPIHTGLDISDGKPSGTTPIKPFKPGRVIETVHSGLGLGNHVVVDNGNGVTSVYGHLYSISVQPGQQVDKETVLGFEGSTGVSTGTHLHFEIRVNGQAANPHLFISGQP